MKLRYWKYYKEGDPSSREYRYEEESIIEGVIEPVGDNPLYFHHLEHQITISIGNEDNPPRLQLCAPHQSVIKAPENSTITFERNGHRVNLPEIRSLTSSKLTAKDHLKIVVSGQINYVCDIIIVEITN